MFQNRIQYTVYSMLVDSIQFPNFLNLLWNLQKISKKWSLLRLLIRNLQSCKLQPYAFLKLLKQCPWWSSFLQNQALRGSLWNNCSKLQLKPSRKACKCYEKDFLIDVLLHNKPRKTTKLRKAKWDFCNANAEVNASTDCQYFQMVQQNYTNHKNSGTGNWVCALFLEYS